MGVVSIPRRNGSAQRTTDERRVDWVNIAAGSALVVSGLLLMSGKRRAGVAVGTAGTTLALLQHEDTVRAWWSRIPALVDDAQAGLALLQERVDEFTEKRNAMHQAVASVAERAGVLHKKEPNEDQ